MAEILIFYRRPTMFDLTIMNINKTPTKFDLTIMNKTSLQQCLTLLL
jgi:hypothetical protein